MTADLSLARLRELAEASTGVLLLNVHRDGRGYFYDASVPREELLAIIDALEQTVAALNKSVLRCACGVAASWCDNPFGDGLEVSCDEHRAGNLSKPKEAEPFQQAAKDVLEQPWAKEIVRAKKERA